MFIIIHTIKHISEKVSNINEISEIIIPHFRKYYLLTQKRADFELFEKIIRIMLRKEYFTVKVLQDIINLKALINLGAFL